MNSWDDWKKTQSLTESVVKAEKLMAEAAFIIKAMPEQEDGVEKDSDPRTCICQDIWEMKQLLGDLNQFLLRINCLLDGFRESIAVAQDRSLEGIQIKYKEVLTGLLSLAEMKLRGIQDLQNPHANPSEPSSDLSISNEGSKTPPKEAVKASQKDQK